MGNNAKNAGCGGAAHRGECSRWESGTPFLLPWSRTGIGRRASWPTRREAKVLRKWTVVCRTHTALVGWHRYV